jgi:MraZ protein
MFRGNQLAKIDEKGRLKVPAAFKQLMDAANVTQFYITSTNGKSAEIWPLPEWEKVEARLAGASALNVAVKTFMNLVNYYGQQVEMDSQGRLLLPQILRTKARLDAEVTVIGMRTYVEVHNREEFEQNLPPEGLTNEFQQAIDEILSGRDDH